MDERDQSPVPLAYEPVHRTLRALPWPARLARIGVIVAYAAMPVQFFIHGEASGKLCGCSVTLLAVSAVLALIVGHFGLVLLAIVGFVMHPLLIRM